MRIALFNLGFRPFFLLAAVFAIIAMSLWIGPLFLSHTLWHAHEMVFGYAVAVIAGFLLTAVRNWTSQKTPDGLPLAVLAATWLVARVLMLLENLQLSGAVFDLVFQTGLLIAIARPILVVRQWRQLPVLVSILTLLAAQTLFVFGLLASNQTAALNGVLLGFYAVIGLILVITGRIMPFFTRSGLGLKTAPKGYPWLERVLMPVYALFVLAAMGDITGGFSRWLAGILAGLNAIRLLGWYVPGIGGKPLLWVLYMAYLWIVTGFGLMGIGQFQYGLHALAVGGLGGITLGMMSRVTLGHTGRSIHHPPAILTGLFALVFAAATLRVFMPLFWPQQSLLWFRLAGVVWIMAFAGFVFAYAAFLIQPRVDGKPG